LASLVHLRHKTILSTAPVAPLICCSLKKWSKDDQKGILLKGSQFLGKEVKTALSEFLPIENNVGQMCSYQCVNASRCAYIKQ